MLVDSHCHLSLLDAKTHGDTAQVLASAREQGVEHVLCVAIDLETFPQVLSIAQRCAGVFASVGVHPNTEVDNEPHGEHLWDLARDPKVIAIGETGLDYYRSRGDLGWQRERFRTHIRVAKAIGKPLIIHTRASATDVLTILQEEGADAVGGVMHCFVDDWETAQRAMALNFYISFSGIVTFRNAAVVQEVARRVPLDRLLVETDAPYLAPVPHRGKPNHPAYVRHVAEHIAVLKGLAVETIEAATTANFFSLFRHAEPIAATVRH